ncbi:MAG: nitronate monooxygenase [Anaerolineales bacterium]|nr:nitronate monooxygenase [Anaerolineales bacterium]
MPKFDLHLNLPLMNAAGSLGFFPDPRGPLDLDCLGAFITSPISLTPRTPARLPRFLPFPGGALLHTGYPNHGLGYVLRHYAAYWARAPLPVIVHLLSDQPHQIVQMVERLEIQEGVTAVEIGLPDEMQAGLARDMAAAAQGELAVVMRLPLHRALELAPVVLEAGAAAISLAPPRGALPGQNGELVRGRLYGPTLFPQALAVVQALAKADLPVIGAGGIYTPEQAKAMLRAGAQAVQLDTVLWRGDWQADAADFQMQDIEGEVAE